MALKDLLTEQNFQSAYLQQYPLHGEFKYGAGPVIASGLKGDPGSGVENFKTTPFGKDQPKGGNSKQPYIRAKIPIGVDNYAFKPYALFGGAEVGITSGGGGILDTINSISSGLIRGGVIGAGIHSVTDVLRLTQFGIDLERGIPFIAKQVGLQLSNIKLEAPSKSAKNPLNNTRIYNLGANTIAQSGVNAFGIHFRRHGLTPNTSLGQEDKTGYYYLATRNNEGGGSPGNRLNKLLKKLSLDGEVASQERKDLYSYSGGPKSVYGIGKTTIRSYVNTIRHDKFFYGELENSTPALYNYLSLDQPHSQKQRTIQGSKQKISLRELKDFRKLKLDSIDRYGGQGAFTENLKKYYQNSTDYSTKNMEQRLRIGTGYDVMSMVPILRATKKLTKNGDDGYNDFAEATGGNTKDLIRFVIEAINNDNPSESDYMHFRAFIDGFGDKYKASWKKYNFVGNPESFYNYDSFDRDISISFKIVVFRKEEQKSLYQKLNFLISNLMPDYGFGNTRARAPYIKLTVGDYIDQLPGFITNLSVSETKGSTWEINLDDSSTVQSLPHALDIKMSFQPIHNFIPRKVTIKSPNVPFITLNTRNDNAIDGSQYFFPTENEAELVTRGAFKDISVTSAARMARDAELQAEQDAAEQAAIDAEEKRINDEIEAERAKELEEQAAADAALDPFNEEFIEEEEEDIIFEDAVQPNGLSGLE
jgi:hypothetical protein